MKDIPFHLHQRALFAFNALTDEEQDAIRTQLSKLSDLPPEQWPSLGARRLAADEPLSLARVDDSLRAMVRPDGGGPEVLDIMRHETLETSAPKTS